MFDTVDIFDKTPTLATFNTRPLSASKRIQDTDYVNAE